MVTLAKGAELLTASAPLAKGFGTDFRTGTASAPVAKGFGTDFRTGTASAPVAKGSGADFRTGSAIKKAAVASGPKFREETPKKGSGKATPIASRKSDLRCIAQTCKVMPSRGQGRKCAGREPTGPEIPIDLNDLMIDRTDLQRPRTCNWGMGHMC